MNATRQQGYSFIELIMSIVVLGIVLSGAVLLFSTAVGSSADPLRRHQAIALAESYLDEILSRRFVDPDGTDGEASRASYDDVDDYANIVSQAPALSNGNPVASLSDYLVTVSVTNEALGGIAAGNVYRVDVTVAYDNTSITLSGYRTNY
ncbi:MAG: type II secretion system protein [Gammaproteobacteria bacterium]|nr:type II secretion system protein [Gammaproteobacteria bacterium]